MNTSKSKSDSWPRLRGTCAYCGRGRCNAEFYDPALRDFDVAHVRCLPERERDRLDERVREILR